MVVLIRRIHQYIIELPNYRADQPFQDPDRQGGMLSNINKSLIFINVHAFKLSSYCLCCYPFTT